MNRLHMATLLLGIASLPVWAAADGWTNKSPQREDSSSSLGDVGSSLRKSQSDTSLGTPARKGISSPPRGRGATTGDMPSIHDPSQPHGFDIDQVVINQHEGRAAGKGSMLETYVTAHISNKEQVEKAKKNTDALRIAKVQEAQLVKHIENNKKNKAIVRESNPKLERLRAKIADLSKTEATDKMRAENSELMLKTTKDSVQKNFPHLTDTHIDALPSQLPKYVDAKMRKDAQRARLLQR